MSGRPALIARASGAITRLTKLHSTLGPYLRPHRARIGASVLLATAYAGLRLLEPWPLQILFDAALLGRPVRFLGVDPMELVGGDKMILLSVAAAAVLAIALLSGALYYWQSILLAGVGQDIVRDLREDVFHQMQRLSLPFHRKAKSGDLLMRLTGDMVLLREMILASLVTLTTQVLVLVSVAALMAAVSLRLTLAAIILAPLVYFLIRFFRKRMIDAARQQRHREGRLASSIEEVLLSIPMIQSYTAEAREDERFRRLTKKSARAGLRGARLEAGMQRSVEILVALATCLVLWVGTREVLASRLTPGTFLVFLAYLRTMLRPIRGISKVSERTARASAAAERVMAVLRSPREIKDSKDARPAPPLAGEICFDHVTFAYEDGAVAMHDVTFHIRPGEHVALVGPTGAGKSTLLSLILRFHKPTEGQILIDGCRIKTYTLQSLRRQITFLPQEPFILGTTIRENLLFGKPDATDAEIRAALKAAALEEFVGSLPMGLDTQIAPRGQSLSGGQKQRLAIARALLKDAPILLLDEPTTGLDALNERDVLESLEGLAAGRTSLTIAHRFATVRRADRILVLEAGRLVEDGPPRQVLERSSLFRTLADLQGFVPPPAGGEGPERIVSIDAVQARPRRS